MNTQNPKNIQISNNEFYQIQLINKFYQVKKNKMLFQKRMTIYLKIHQDKEMLRIFNKQFQIVLFIQNIKQLFSFLKEQKQKKNFFTSKKHLETEDQFLEDLVKYKNNSKDLPQGTLYNLNFCIYQFQKMGFIQQKRIYKLFCQNFELKSFIIQRIQCKQQQYISFTKDASAAYVICCFGIKLIKSTEKIPHIVFDLLNYLKFLSIEIISQAQFF
eukprot:TRINITY_DN12208_c0_g1_i1.p1 TRINITY_DN12208_c0_g1~~TRINITY_DN12208_c0_g1_i1.p1  ORF type:complete len:215 (-),score=26.77 TRINITY_DN12208_c0_g1_i1:103-747(-)